MTRLSPTPLRAAPSRLFLTAATAAWLAAPSSLEAGQYYPPVPSTAPSTAGSDRARQQPSAPTAPAEVHRAAACVAGREPAAAAEILTTAHYSAQERQQATSLLRSAQRCIRSRDAISTSSSIFRGAIAEALYEAQFTASQPVRTPAVPVSPSRLDAAAPEAAAPLAPALALADCSVGAQPETIRAVLATEVGSAEEMAALRGLNSVFAGCLTPGSSLNADRATLRAMLADSLYRWSVVQRDGTASAWAAASPAPVGN